MTVINQAWLNEMSRQTTPAEQAAHFEFMYGQKRTPLDVYTENQMWREMAKGMMPWPTVENAPEGVGE